jgi:chemotaxis methyl-accepting protein methylase
MPSSAGLIIYFERATQHKLLPACRCLKTGHLFLGHSETVPGSICPCSHLIDNLQEGS